MEPGLHIVQKEMTKGVKNDLAVQRNMLVYPLVIMEV
jgi:hypothetical protein